MLPMRICTKPRLQSYEGVSRLFAVVKLLADLFELFCLLRHLYHCPVVRLKRLGQLGIGLSIAVDNSRDWPRHVSRVSDELHVISAAILLKRTERLTLPESMSSQRIARLAHANWIADAAAVGMQSACGSQSASPCPVTGVALTRTKLSFALAYCPVAAKISPA